MQTQNSTKLTSAIREEVSHRWAPVGPSYLLNPTVAVVTNAYPVLHQAHFRFFPPALVFF